MFIFSLSPMLATGFFNANAEIKFIQLTFSVKNKKAFFCLHFGNIYKIITKNDILYR